MSLMRQSMQVLQSSQYRQHGGVSDYQWDTAGVSYPCSLQPVSASKQVNLGMMDVRASHTLFWNPKVATITDTSRIKIDETVYKVVTKGTPTDGQEFKWPGEAFVVEAHP